MSSNSTEKSKRAIIIRHVAFEDLGLLDGPLEQTGYQIDYLEAGVADLGGIDPLGPDLVIILGGPIGVYETEIYPFLNSEIQLLKARLAAERPTLGICLGAQLIATALGAEVFPSGIKEIGWSPITLTDAGRRSPLRHLENLPVLHWHGDTFDLPHGARHLALTDVCAQQAFAVGPNILGLQFHAEIDAAAGIERWLIGHTCELAGAGIDPRELRQQTSAIPMDAASKCQSFFSEWLTHLSFPND